MRRRLTIAMVLMVLGTLLLSGVVSLALVHRSERNQTREELVREAEEFPYIVQQEADKASSADPAKALRSILLALRSPLSLDGSAILAIVDRASGLKLIDPAQPAAKPELPAGLSASNLDTAALFRLKPESGFANGLAYAAYPDAAQIFLRAPRLGVARNVNVVLVVVLTRRPPSALASAGPWFALSSLVILVVAALVAGGLGRRFVRPIQAARQVTGRIAGGDLDARVPAPPGTDPELAALADSVNAMAARLAQAKGAERQFFQSVSHELRTPLTSIRGFAEAIEDGATTDFAAAGRVIASEARRLERLVADLLGLATLEARRFTLHLEPVDLAAAASAATAGFVPAAVELGLTLVVDPSPGPVGVNVDRDRLAQIAANLIENAMRFAHHEVHVGAAGRPGEAILWVQDDGPGIAPEDLVRVFERLYQSRPAPGRTIGTGLGLAIVAELVAAMGGRVWADSPVSPTGGTRMVVTFPAVALAKAVTAPAPVTPMG
jgi:two-component system sensor histidine kinase BaeS